MKKILVLGIFLLTLIITGCEQIDEEVIIDESDIVQETIIEEDDSDETTDLAYDESNYGSLGALSDDDLSIEAMLIYALEDEYAARAEYEYILNNFDVTTPFSNIIKSEENHISMLIPLFETYGIDVIEDESSSHLVVIDDLKETYETGIIAEEYNIAMYELFLSQDDLPLDIQDVFTKLRDASINHLNAFIKNAEKA